MKHLFSIYGTVMKMDNIHSIFKFSHNLFFINKIEEINAIFGQQQVENISFTLSLIINRNKHDRIEQLKKTNLNKSIEWCNKYNVAHDSVGETENIFLQKSKPYGRH
tara:strand:+ start:126 stop:446 length:321 start_codon:yes stop_codon:yes gene_type:complete